MSGAGVTITIEGRELALSNLDKVLYPEVGFTKAEVINYYTRIAPVMLPHIAGRAMTLKRYPNGVDQKFFFEKNCPSHRPPWVQTAPIYSGQNDKDIDYCLIDETPALAWTANLASLELHPSLSLARDPATPTLVAFDLDPGAPAAFVECCELALILRETLEHLGLKSFAKSSGNKGLQVYAPLNTPTNYDEGTTPFAHAIARLLERQYPAKVVSNMRKDLRKGKIFVDWSQNNAHKTTIAVYSLRATPRPMVSAPITWDEVAKVAETRDPSFGMFDAPTVLARVEEFGDVFAEVATLQQELPEVG
ncbi:ATP-dependent DNA ligase [bacterium SCGC AG-212-C10]|nr:ATP-dependent DNA ligase [bacterium SCGC AG-212-C10]